jgi:hypothetical protein
MRVLVTGARDWQDYDRVVFGLSVAIEDLTNANPADKTITVVHGGARGADSMAGRYVEQTRDFFAGHGITIRAEVHKADWTKYGKGAGPIRNQEMIDAGADICVAFRFEESRGTADCVNRARKAGIKVTEYRA